MIHKGDFVLVVEGPHSGKRGKVVSTFKIWQASTSTSLKAVEIEEAAGTRFKVRMSFVREERVDIESEEKKRAAEV